MPPTHKESLSSLGSNRSASSLSGSSSSYRNPQDSGEETDSVLRLGSWCCEGVGGQADSLDIILYNDGSPIDIMLLQATQQPCPSIDGYQLVESVAPEYDPTAGVAIYWRDVTVKGSTERFESELPGRIIKINLSWRENKSNFNVVNFHGYSFGKKGNRSKIELLELLRERKGLTKKKRNILGGNFNFVEQIQDRKREGAVEAFNREQQVRDFFVNLSRNFRIKETFAAENAKLYQSQAPSLRVPLSHQGVARTDRIYLSDEMFQDYSTSTSYIDNSGDNDHCIVEILSPGPEREVEDNIIQPLSQVNGGMGNTPITMPIPNPMVDQSQRILDGLQAVMEKLNKQETELENIRTTLKDIKQRI